MHRRALEAKEKSTPILGTEFDGYDSQWLKTGNMHMLQTARTFLGFSMPCFIYLGTPSSRFEDIDFSRLPDSTGSLLVSLRALTLGTSGAGFGTAEAQLGIEVSPSMEVHPQREQDPYGELLKRAKGMSLILLTPVQNKPGLYPQWPFFSTWHVVGLQSVTFKFRLQNSGLRLHTNSLRIRSITISI